VLINRLVVQLQNPLEMTEQAAEVSPAYLSCSAGPCENKACGEWRNLYNCWILCEMMSSPYNNTSQNSALADTNLFMLSSWILKGHGVCLP